MKRLPWIIALWIACLVNVRGEEGRVICPECKSDGVKSTSYMMGCSSTLLAQIIAYDEEGNRIHSENPNVTTCSFHCSNGHTWSEELK